MKRLKSLSILLLLISAFTFSQCKKNKDTPQLPPETTTGAMTFGCKIDGKVFVPQDGRGKSGLRVEYANLGTGPGGGWYLSIAAVDWKPSFIPFVNITTDSLLVTEGTTYTFKKQKGYPKAICSTDKGLYYKLENDIGNLYISKFDQINRIMSGTFSFVGTNSNLEKVEVTEGRFDIRY